MEGGFLITPHVGSVVNRKKSESTFCVWRFGCTQTCISGLLRLGPWGY